MASNYPPGHPTGSYFSVAHTECPSCGEDVTIHCEYERDTNASIVDDAVCENCNHEFTHKQLDKLDWGSPEDERDWDAEYDRRIEQAEMEDREDPFEGY